MDLTGRLTPVDGGLAFRSRVRAGATALDLALGLGVLGLAVGGTALAGGSALALAVSGVVGAILGQVPAAIRPRYGELVLEVDGQKIHWSLREGDAVDERQVALRDVCGAEVMPHEGQGWGVEIHHRELGRRRIWNPRLPLPSAEEAQRLVDWIRANAGA